MEGEGDLAATSGNKLTVSSVTRRVQEVTRGAPYVTSCTRVRPERNSYRKPSTLDKFPSV
jgi:hypothetical protein